MDLTCPTCRQRSRHPPNQILGHWAICPFCGGEIDWRQLTPPIGVPHCSSDVAPLTTPNEENE